MNNKRYTKDISDKQTYCGYEVKDCKYQQIYGFESYDDLEEFVDCDLTLAIDKLGAFEDFVEKHSIPNMRYLENCIIKHDKYGELEEELGCPLDVIIKALTNGVYVIDEETKELQYILRGFHTFTGEGLGASAGFSDERIWRKKTNKAGIEFNPIYFWKDYKKTWFLKEDKSE